MSVRIVVAPTVEPVTLTEAKNHLRVEETRDDSFIQTLISVARQHIEKECWRGLLPQTLELSQASFRGEDRQEQLPDYRAGWSDASRFAPFIHLPQGHLAATPAVAVTYLDTTGALQTLSTSAYNVQSRGEQCGRLWLNTLGGYTWPEVCARPDAVRIQYTVGWATRALVPAPIKHAVLLLVSQLYEYRTPEVTGTIATMLQFTVDALTANYRLVRL